MAKNYNTLAELPAGKSAVISSIECEDKALRSHIMNMGITPGVRITMVKKAPLGDPLEINVRGYELTLRKNDAAKINITDAGKFCPLPPKSQDFSNIEHSKIGESSTYQNKKDSPDYPERPLRLALVGNQNCGKTTLFNKLTGANQHVGNFPGVTIDRTDGIVKNHPEVTITDLPGIYSLSPYSKEEIVSRNFILNEKPDAIINIVDAGNIERNLFLTMQLIELNVPMVIALNMMDEVNKNGGNVNVNALENVLGVPVIPISAAKNEGVEELIEHAVNVARYKEFPHRLDFCDADSKTEGCLHRCIHSIVHLIEDHAKRANLPPRFAATKLIEGDMPIINALNLDKSEKQTCSRIISDMEKERGLDKEAALADMRFSFIERLCEAFVFRPEETIGHKLTIYADKILTGKYTALFAFIAIMASIFYLTFGSLGLFLSDTTESLIAYVTDKTDEALTAYG